MLVAEGEPFLRAAFSIGREAPLPKRLHPKPPQPFDRAGSTKPATNGCQIAQAPPSDWRGSLARTWRSPNAPQVLSPLEEICPFLGRGRRTAALRRV